MAKKDTASSTYQRQGKRLARAKVKAPARGADGKKKRAGATASGGASARGAGKASGQDKAKKKLTLAEARSRRKKRITAVIIVIFAVLMALSLMLPSFAAIFANQNAQQAAEQDQQGGSSSSGDSDGSSSKDEAQDMSTVSGVDASYQETVSPLEDKLQGDPDDLATLLALGNDYMSWGYQVTQVASSDADTSHASDLLAQAEQYYDQYLALNDSPMVRTNRALCQYYSGDTAGATSALEELTQADPDFGPAWANLGLMYETAGDTDKAKEAYNQAEAADADDEYGAKSFAESRLASIASSESQSATGATSSSTGSSATGAQGLTDALGNGL